MEKERVKKILVELYNDFQTALIKEEEKGRGNYSEYGVRLEVLPKDGAEVIIK